MQSKNWLTDKDYNFIYERSPRLCVDLAIKDPRGILLTKRLIQPYKNTWHMPGGRVKFRESLQHAVDRIARTEIGIKVKVQELLGCIEFPRELQSGRPRHSVSLVWLVKPLNRKIKGSWQAEDYRYFKKASGSILPKHCKFLKDGKFLK